MTSHGHPIFLDSLLRTIYKEHATDTLDKLMLPLVYWENAKCSRRHYDVKFCVALSTGNSEAM